MLKLPGGNHFSHTGALLINKKLRRSCFYSSRHWGKSVKKTLRTLQLIHIYSWVEIKHALVSWFFVTWLCTLHWSTMNPKLQFLLIPPNTDTHLLIL